LAILFFSGYWLVRRWVRNADLDFTATLISGAVAALAAWLAFLAWASLFLTLGRASVGLIVLASTLFGLVQFIRDRERWWKRDYWLGKSPWSTLAFWLVVLLSIALRLFVGRDMVVLPGSDTYHHTLIVKLFEEQGGLPRSYEPYAPLTSYSYHFGFHGIVALFRWLFGTELLATTKTVALVLNGAVAAVAGLVAERWAGNRRAGVVTAAVVGLIAVTPFALLRWGRFTQITGLLFLAASLLAMIAMRQGSGWALPSLLIAGLAFSHFRIVLLLALFLLAAAGMRAAQGRWAEVKDWLILGVASFLIAAPWLLRVVWVQYDPDGLRSIVPALEGVNNLRRLETPVLSFVTNLPLLVLSLLAAAVIWLSKRADRQGQLDVIWIPVAAVGVLALSAAGIPFFLDVKTTLLSISVPLGILMGLAVELLWDRFGYRKQVWVRLAIGIVLLTGIGVGVLRLPRVMQQETADYVRPGDLVAMDWIAQNVGDDALILVKSIQVPWSPGWVVGIDSGYWIPLLAHRAVTVPPMIYPMEWGRPVELASGVGASLESQTIGVQGTSRLGEILDSYGITHVFVGSQQDPMQAQLTQEARLRPIYRQDGIWLFEVVR
jgi:hypothetical protein